MGTSRGTDSACASFRRCFTFMTRRVANLLGSADATRRLTARRAWAQFDAAAISQRQLAVRCWRLVRNYMLRSKAAMQTKLGERLVRAQRGLWKSLAQMHIAIQKCVSQANFNNFKKRKPRATQRFDLRHRMRRLQAMDLSRFSAAPSARLSHLPFKSDGAFPAQC